MVKFIPPYMGKEIKSNAEKKMYDVLQDLNIDDAYVLHSLGLPKSMTVEEMKAVDIRTVDRETLVDIREVKIDRSLSLCRKDY